WGITEPKPKEYSFKAYRQLVREAKRRRLKVQMVSSFHQCGGNIGDACYIPLPEFVRKETDIWYKDAGGKETQEYISLFADDVVVGGRTPLQMYSDWFTAFAAEFAEDLGAPIIEVMVGLGPCGEMRYPAYPLDRWSFPGIGQFQCHDKHALESLRGAAQAAGCEDCASPPAAGNYDDEPKDTDFFTNGYSSENGRFFLEWYSDSLKKHAVNILQHASQALGKEVKISAKISGLHWWYDSNSHAAELTAGYYNTNERNAYLEIANVIRDAGAQVLDFTCLEMRDLEQPAHARSSPQKLVAQVIQAAKEAGLAFAGENALQRYDQRAYEQMLSYKELRDMTLKGSFRHEALLVGGCYEFGG
ncbi:BAM3, partial [Symbiodinium pilosum]